MTYAPVYFIGAGPGDPDLLTVRGLACLRTADVVIHDHLVSPRLLTHARLGAELIDVGRAAPQPNAREAIGYLLVEKAREGRTVARLKWGDPFVFGQGSDEARFLQEQGVPFEVVPGLPAGIAVPAYAGIPITAPGSGSTVTLLQGFEDESRTLPDVDWASLAKVGGTLVCYAGPQQASRMLEALRAHGWAADDRAAFVANGTLATQETIEGTLAELTDAIRERARRDPGVLVVGRAVRLRDRLRWFDIRPLFGRRVLVTRPREQASELVDRLTALGAETIEAPMLQIVPPEDIGPLRAAASRAGEFDWMLFASVNAVDAFMRALYDSDRDVRSLKGPLIGAVGDVTAARLDTHGIKADLVPDEFRAEALVTALLARGPIAGQRILLPRGEIGRDVIADQLRDAGAYVADVIAYRTVPGESAGDDEASDVYRHLLDGRIDVVTFTSPSAVRNFVRLFGQDQATDLLAQTVVATIGPVTAEAAGRLGIAVTVQPDAYTIPALVDAIAAYYRRESPGPQRE